MRTSYSIKNSITSAVSYFIAIVIGIVAQSLFIRFLGMEYLGLNGLFTNILTVLSIFDLGVGSAIVYNLYKPIADNDVDKIKSLMLFYKKAYNFIAIIIFLAGLIVIPFLTKIVGKIDADVNLYVIYIMFLINTVSSYLMSYKRSLVCAYQKNYIVNIVHIFYLLFINVTRLFLIFLLKNYYVYLAITIFGQLLENFIITLIANKQYPYLLDKNVTKIDKGTEKNIFKKVKALIFHKVGSVIINGTDNIIISSFLGVVTVGLYSSYTLIINPITSLLSQFMSSTTASVGNLLVTENTEKIYNVFKRIRFLNFLLSCVSGICLFVIIQPFVEMWIGKQYLLPMSVICTIVFNYFQKTMRSTYNVFKDSAGIWQEDKYIPLIESILNIFFSIFLLKIFGLSGVFMGTIISGLILWLYSYPKFVYKKIFKRNYINYLKETFGYICLFIILTGSTYFISTLFVFDNIFLKFIVNSLIAIIFPIVILIIIFRKTDNYNYFKELIIKIMAKFKKIKLKKS